MYIPQQSQKQLLIRIEISPYEILVPWVHKHKNKLPFKLT